MSDPDVTEQERIARDYLVSVLRPRTIAGVDPDQLAAHYIAWLRREGWWPALKPPRRDRPADGQHNAATYKAGIELARKALADATKGREDQ